MKKSKYKGFFKINKMILNDNNLTILDLEKAIEDLDLNVLVLVAKIYLAQLYRKYEIYEAKVSASIKYPIYIPSKGRAKFCFTAKSFDKYQMDFNIVVEPLDKVSYISEFGKERIIVLDKNDMGIAFSRRSIKQISIERGEDWHWQIDDNIGGFTFRNKDMKGTGCHPTRVLSEIEKYCFHFLNIAISSPSHACFFDKKSPRIAFNKQVFSCVFINNSVPILWRDNCIEDIDYSLQCLTLGYVTIKFMHLQMSKPTSSLMAGGHDYSIEYRLKKSMEIEALWPNIFKIDKKTGKIRPSNIWKSFSQRPSEDLL